jgi:hypothetical protein
MIPYGNLFTRHLLVFGDNDDQSVGNSIPEKAGRLGLG